MSAVAGIPAFYIEERGAYRATELTRGPWDEASQHAGPPCALLGRALDLVGGIEGGHLGRITFEILKPVPISTLSVAARVVRPGRRVEMVEGELLAGGQELVRARAWRVRTAAPEDRVPAAAQGEPAALPGPSSAAKAPFFPVPWDVGYHTAVETRFVSGSFAEPGPAIAWMRIRVPLIEGVQTSQRDRVLVVADSGNGVSSPLDYRRYLFINTDLTVSLRRLPRGDWVGLDAVSFVEPFGAGLSDTALHDQQGMIGRSTQTLLVAQR